jgi:hypothetical protein
VHGGVALQDALAERIDRGAVADVAELDLPADLLRERSQPILAARNEDAMPALLREQPRSRLADAGGRSRYDRDALNAFTVPMLISTVSRMSSA